ncbi:hypothetical protein BGZ76_010907 [Entomortierella beljakovae]|nr:hypothetical protein BGZ76_010907 [Entomortierella beljakovae]
MNAERAYMNNYSKDYKPHFNQKQHQTYDRDPGVIQPPNSDNNNRRKRPLHFEPEFIAALDASLQEQSRSRPTKKSRFSTPTTAASSTASPSPPSSSSSSSSSSDDTTPSIIQPTAITSPIHSIRTTPNRSRSLSPSSPSEGISIIDLSSGEELVPFHLGENEHKRRRDSTVDSSSSESLQEIFNVLDDGSIHPVTDHVPIQPSPIKRQRLHKTDQRPSRLKIFEENEPHSILSTHSKRYPSTKRVGFSGVSDFRNGSRNNQGDNNTEEDCAMNDIEEAASGLNNSKKTPASKAQLGALIRYEGPKSMKLAEGVDALIQPKWECRSIDPPALNNAQGNELVLYRRPPPTYFSTLDDDDYEPCQGQQRQFPRIEELTDDMHIGSDQSDDASIDELESKIMSMDID